MHDRKVIVLPFLKWAGGKRWLTSAHPELLEIAFDRYIEPFLGSAAVFFHLAPKKSILSDQNSELIETYQAIKDNWALVKAALDSHHKKHSKKYYYSVRDMRPLLAHTRAARFIYLNRTCWNGLYRVNLRGQFNVPIGTKDKVVLDSDDFAAVARILANADLRAGDFEATIDLAGPKDLVFVDPPYTVKHNLNGFVKYNEKLFSWEDQERLRDCVIRASHRGAAVVVLNANHHSVKDLYKGVGAQRILTRSSVLAASTAHRGQYQELIIRC
jgi:DNA adenine methylase